MYNSFAIWYKKRGNQEEASDAELHFNLWQFSSQKDDRLDCLDIGIKIDKISEFSSVNLFVPFELESKDIRDLGKTITKDRKIITAIFNEFSNFDKETKPKLKRIKLSTEGNNCSEEFDVYEMDEGNDIELIPHEEGEPGLTQKVGTIIKIKTEQIDGNNVPVYLRIRIDLPSQNISGKIVHHHEPKDSWLQSSITKNQFIDFRLNEKRNLPTTIQEKCVNKFLKIKKIHFFLMREFADELIMSDPDNSGYRVLESDTWSEYFSEKPELKLNHMFAYHWKAPSKKENNKNKIDSFTLSTKFSFQESSNWKIVVFLFIALVIGAFGGVAGNLLTDWVKELFTTSEHHVEIRIID